MQEKKKIILSSYFKSQREHSNNAENTFLKLSFTKTSLKRNHNYISQEMHLKTLISRIEEYITIENI